MKSSIGETLKKCRLNAGKSVKEISDLLISKGFKASEKTIYSWESGNSQPSPDAFLIMCKAYNLSDILRTFGYANNSAPNVKPASADNYEFIKKYRELDAHGKDMVDTVLQKEYDHVIELHDSASQMEESTKDSGNIITIDVRTGESAEKESLEPNAAHDLNPTKEQKEHADDIMKNDKEWI